MDTPQSSHGLPKQKPSVIKNKPGKTKKVGILIEYGNPDSRIIVRLLPPTLEKGSFLEQAKLHSPTLRSGYSDFRYQKGAKQEKPFESPVFSWASIKFNSQESAHQVRLELTDAVFEEPNTGDFMKCQVVKPIYGTLYQPPPVVEQETLIDDDLFKSFAKLREENGGEADLRVVIKDMNAKKNQKKQQEPNSRKRPGKKAPVKDFKDQTKASKNAKPKKKSKTKIPNTDPTVIDVNSPRDEGLVDHQKKTKRNRKKSKKEKDEKDGDKIQSMANEPSGSKQKGKQVRKNNKMKKEGNQEKTIAPPKEKSSPPQRSETDSKVDA